MEERAYIVSIVEELFDIIPICMITNQFDESATRLARCCTSIGERGVCLLRVGEQSTRNLKRIRKGYPEVLSEYLLYETPRRLNQARHQGLHGQRAG